MLVGISRCFYCAADARATVPIVLRTTQPPAFGWRVGLFMSPRSISLPFPALPDQRRSVTPETAAACVGSRALIAPRHAILPRIRPDSGRPGCLRFPSGHSSGHNSPG